MKALQELEDKRWRIKVTISADDSMDLPRPLDRIFCARQ
jgi:hypothetical protein